MAKKATLFFLLTIPFWSGQVLSQEKNKEQNQRKEEKNKNNSQVVVIEEEEARLSETPEKAPYQDKIINAENLQVLAPDEDEDDAEASLLKKGLPKSLTVEILVGQSRRGEIKFNEYQVQFRGYQTTRRFGDLSLDARATRQDGQYFPGQTNNGQANNEKNKNSFQATIWQRNFFVSDDWYMNNGLGILNTPSTNIQRQQQRFFLPSVPFAGVSSEIISTKTGTVVQASTGKMGVIQGGRSTSFDIQSGNVSSLGAEWRRGEWQAGVSMLAVDGAVTRDGYDYTFNQGPTQSLYAGVRRQTKKHSSQVNMVVSQSDEGGAFGLWADDEWKRGRMTHSAGAFYLGDGLAWGAYPINNNTMGGYYRVNYLYGKLSWNASVDYIDSINNEGFSGVYSTSSFRYQKTRLTGFGGALSQRSGSDSAYSAMMFVDRKTRFGQSRAQIQRSQGTSNQENQITLDQTFKTKEGTRLAASLSLARGSYNDFSGLSGNPVKQKTETAQLNLYGGINITDKLSFDGTLGFTHGNGFYATRGLNMNVGANWTVTDRLSLQATLYKNQGRQRAMFTVDPLADPNEFSPLPRDQSFALSLRYDLQAGRPAPILGAVSSRTAASDMKGEIFFDENKDGLRNASENGIENIAITLDGKYTVYTDNQGRFRFSNVAVGQHQINVLEDNIPLPWSLSEEQKTKSVKVHLHGDNNTSLGVTKND